MLVNEVFVLILELLPALQLSQVFDLLCGGSGSFQLLKNAFDMVPLFHLPRRLAEGVGNDLSDAHDALHDFVLAFLASRGAALGVLHDEPLLRHVCLAGEILTGGNVTVPEEYGSAGGRVEMINLRG